MNLCDSITSARFSEKAIKTEVLAFRSGTKLQSTSLVDVLISSAEDHGTQGTNSNSDEIFGQKVIIANERRIAKAE